LKEAPHLPLMTLIESLVAVALDKMRIHSHSVRRFARHDRYAGFAYGVALWCAYTVLTDKRHPHPPIACLPAIGFARAYPTAKWLDLLAIAMRRTSADREDPLRRRLRGHVLPRVRRVPCLG
jgi:hypothetical protein